MRRQRLRLQGFACPDACKAPPARFRLQGFACPDACKAPLARFRLQGFACPEACKAPPARLVQTEAMLKLSKVVMKGANIYTMLYKLTHSYTNVLRIKPIYEVL